MTIPNIDTFEHDIASEIVQKEASIGDIASASNDVANAPSTPSSKLPLMIGVGVISILIMALGIGGYLYYVKATTPIPVPEPTSGLGSVPAGLPLASVSKTLDDNIGRFLTYVQKNESGYSMTVTSYSPVFAYMNGHENDFASELAAAVGSPQDTSTTTTPYIFTDATIQNQNMRVGTSASSTVIYAFANPQLLLIASTPEQILALRNAILR